MQFKPGDYAVWIYKNEPSPIYEMITDVFRQEDLVVNNGIITYRDYKKS